MNSILGLFDVDRWRLFPKFLVAFLLATLVPMGLIAYIASSLAYDALLENGAKTLLTHSESTARLIDAYLTNRREDAVVISGLPEIVAFATNPTSATARANGLQALRAMARRRDYSSVSIANPTGIVILSSVEQEINSDIRLTAYFREALGGQVYISDPSISLATDEPNIFFSAPIFDQAANVLGVAILRLNLYEIWSFVEADRDLAGTGTVGLLLDENGIRLASSLTKDNRPEVSANLLYRSVATLPAEVAQKLVLERRFGQTTSERIVALQLPEVAQALKDQSGKIFETSADFSTARHYAALTKLERKPWRYIVMVPLTVFTSPSDQIRSAATFIAIIVAIFTGIAAYQLADRLAKPLIQLTQVADRISLGELDAQVGIARGDEIGELAEAVERMQISLRAAIERLRARRSA